MLGDFLPGLIVTLLPERFRRRWLRSFTGDVRVASIVSGLAQAFACVGIGGVRYYAFVQQQIHAMDERIALGAASQGGDMAIKALGILFLFAYLLQPLTVVLIYFAFEGVVRMMAAVVNGEVVGTLPLYVVDWAMVKMNERAREAAMGPRVADEVTPAPDGEQEYDLLIASCRPKSEWTAMTTISYDEQFYELASASEGSFPRRFVYRLRKAPQYKIVRGLHHYHPEEVLQ